MPVNQDRTVVITGAANGLGKALALEFFNLGYHLALIDIDGPGLIQLREGLAGDSRRITIHSADVSKEEEIISVRTDIAARHGRVDILVNNAAVANSQLFNQVEITDFRELFNVNFWGTVYCARYFLQDLKKQADSRLVNIISGFALMGFPGKTTYGGLVKKGKHIDEERRRKEAVYLERNGMPLDEAAQRIVKQIVKGRSRIVVGTRMYWTDLAARLFPTMLHRMIGRNKSKFDFI